MGRKVLVLGLPPALLAPSIDEHLARVVKYPRKHSFMTRSQTQMLRLVGEFPA